MLYFKISEPDSRNIVNHDMNARGLTEANLPFWYNVNDNEYILKISAQNCKCHTNMVGFEKDESKIDVEFTKYTTKINIGYTCVLHNIITNNPEE